jgi:hypothetical protein
MFDEIWSVLRDVRGGVERLRNVLSMTHASTKLLRFVYDDVWSRRGVCQITSRSIAEYLIQAGDVRNSCKHSGAVLPLVAAPPRGAGPMTLMLWLDGMIMTMMTQYMKHRVAGHAVLLLKAQLHQCGWISSSDAAGTTQTACRTATYSTETAPALHVGFSIRDAHLEAGQWVVACRLSCAADRELLPARAAKQGQVLRTHRVSLHKQRAELHTGAELSCMELEHYVMPVQLPPQYMPYPNAHQQPKQDSRASNRTLVYQLHDDTVQVELASSANTECHQ